MSWNYFQTLYLLNRWRKYFSLEEPSMMITDWCSICSDAGPSWWRESHRFTGWSTNLNPYCGAVDRDQKNWTCSRNELPPDMLSVCSMDRGLSGEATAKALLSDIWPAAPRWGVSDTWGRQCKHYDSISLSPPEKLKAAPRGGRFEYLYLLHPGNSWSTNVKMKTLKSKLRVCTLGSYLLYNCKNINDCVSVQIWIQIKFFPTYTDNKRLFYSFLFSMLLVSALSVGESNIHRFRGFSRFTTLLLQFFNQCLSFHQWVKIKVSFESGVS